MDNLIIKRYENFNAFLKDAEIYLYEQEVYNSVFLTTLQQQKDNACHYSAIWDTTTDTMIFSLFAIKDSFLYASGILDLQDEPMIELLVKDFLSTLFPFKALSAYEPTLGIVKKVITENSDKKFKLMDDLWSHDIRKVQWSPRSLELKNMPTTKLVQATYNDLPIVMKYTEGFLQDTSPDLIRIMAVDVAEMCRKELDGSNVYLLYCDNLPVCMTWKRRPLRDGCSVAFVYTPEEYRRKGFGGACVSMCTELFLKDYKYITLFIKGSRDPYKNMYTDIGYQLLGKIYRYSVE